MADRITIDGRTYRVEVIRRRQEPPSAPRLITVCYNTSAIGVEVTRVMVDSVVRFTAQPHELWVIDNASPPEHQAWLRALDGVNVVLNQTAPISPARRGWRRLLRKPTIAERVKDGSYANALGLALGLHVIPPETQQVFTMHNDVLATHPNWLPFLQSKLSAEVPMVGVLKDRHRDRIGALHILGLLFDYQLYQQLGASVFPDLPRLDVGDRISEVFRAAGYGEFVCANTYNDPDLDEHIPADAPLAAFPYSVRVLDDAGRVIYGHLARGTAKASGLYEREDRTTPEEWVAYARRYLLND